jgi:hypothetical protein
MARYLKEHFDSILPSHRTEVSETVRELVWVMLSSGNCSAARYETSESRSPDNKPPLGK